MQVTTEERIWLAGFFDADGCISLSAFKNHLGFIRAIQIAIGITHEATADRISEIISRAGIRHYRQTQVRKPKNEQPIFTVRVQSLRTSRAFVNLIGPWVFTKREEIQVLDEYLTAALAKMPNGRKTLTKEENEALWDVFLSCRRRIRRLNNPLRPEQPSGHPRDYTRYAFTEMKAKI